MTGRCLCGIALPAADHPVSEVMGFAMMECPSAPPDELWFVDTRYAARPLAGIVNIGATEGRSPDA